MQLSPTANISLIEDVNAKLEDGSYKYPEPPSVEAQHAIRVFGAIPHVFELRGTKRFKPGDPLIEFAPPRGFGRASSGGLPASATASETRGTCNPNSAKASG